MVDSSWLAVTVGLLGGLALFLLGLQQLTRALQNVASDRLRRLLLVFSRHPARGAASGAMTTAVIQSSTATVVLLVGFVAAGAMSLRQAVPVVLGANVGTTLTMQVIAFDVTAFALAMIATGFVGTNWRRHPHLNGPARSLLALGLMFLGMAVMGDAVAPLQDHPAIADLLAAGSTVFAAFVAGAIITVIVQSSSATGGLLIVLVSYGIIGVEPALAAMIGASIGTCVTPIIAGLGTSRAGLRVALVHLAVNVAGAAVWIWWVPQLAEFATQVSLEWVSNGDVSHAARDLANSYTLYKLATMVILLPVARPLAALAERIVADRPSDDQRSLLDDDVLSTPDVALELAWLQTAQLAHDVTRLVTDGVPIALHGGPDALASLAARDEHIDATYARIVEYLGDIGRGELSEAQGDELVIILATAHDLEAIGDVVETNLATIGRRRLTEGVLPSAPTTELVMRLHACVVSALAALGEALDRPDGAVAIATTMEALEAADALAREAFVHLARRLRTDAPNRVRSFEREMEIVSQLQRISGIARHLAASQSPRPTFDER